MHSIYFFALQAHGNTIPAYIQGAVILVLLLVISVVSQTVYIRVKKNRLVQQRLTLADKFEKELMQTSIDVQSDTLVRVGNELHDNVGQLLSTTRLFLAVAERTTSQPIPALASADDTISKAIDEIRNLAKFLNPDWLSQFDLYHELDADIQRINAAGEILISVDREGPIPLEPQQQFILHRVIQEIIQNVLKHADAKKLRIAVTQNDLHIMLNAADDGHGFNTSTVQRGLGLGIMQHRIQTLGGTIRFTSSSCGTTFTILIPVKSIS